MGPLEAIYQTREILRDRPPSPAPRPIRPERETDPSRRRHLLPLLIRERDRRRAYRAMERATCEQAARKARRDALAALREARYAARFRAIEARVIAEKRVRPPGKAPASYRAYSERLQEALSGDAEYRRLLNRKRRSEGLLQAIARERQTERLLAGVLAVDLAPERRAKVRRHREAKQGGLMR